MKGGLNMNELKRVMNICLRPNIVAFDLPRDKVMRELLPPGIQ